MGHTLGILVAGEPPVELADRYRGYGTMTAELLHTADASMSFRQYDIRAGDYPAGPQAHDAWLITGSRHAAYEDLPWIGWLEGFIRELDTRRIPLVGICFGHQLIARALGGAVTKAPQGWGVGVHEAGITGQASWIDPDARSFRLVVSHQDQVTALPECAEPLASSAFCPVAMYHVGDHIFAMQAHPEFSREYSRDLMEVRRGLIGGECIDAGISSLAKETDAPRVARWIVAFLNHAWTR